MGFAIYKNLAFIGAIEFRDMHSPKPAKNEYGVDSLDREMRGPLSLFDKWYKALKQGQVFEVDGNKFYLQTFRPIEDGVFPGASLSYLGLMNGLPDATYEDSYSIQTATSPIVGSSVEYQAPTTVWRWVSTNRKNTHSDIHDPERELIFWKGLFQGGQTLDDFDVFPRVTDSQAIPIIGTPWHQCSATVQRVYEATE